MIRSTWCKVSVGLTIVLFCVACQHRLPVLEYPGVSRVNPPDWPALSGPVWSPDGSRLAVSSGTGGPMTPTGQIYILDMSTGELRSVEETDYGYRSAETWSPDGNEIVFSAGLDIEGIWIVNVSDEGKPRFLSEGYRAALSPDGQQMAILDLTRDQETDLWTRSIWILNLNTGDRQAVFSGSGELTSSTDLSWSPDGGRLAFDFGAGERTEPPIVESDIYTLDLATGEILELTHGGFNSSPTWSPDGKMIAYAGEPDYTLVIARADGTCSVQPLSVTGVSRPAWSPDGSQIAFSWHGGIYVMDIAAVLGEDFLTAGPVCP